MTSAIKVKQGPTMALEDLDAAREELNHHERLHCVVPFVWLRVLRGKDLQTDPLLLPLPQSPPRKL